MDDATIPAARRPVRRTYKFPLYSYKDTQAILLFPNRLTVMYDRFRSATAALGQGA